MSGEENRPTLKLSINQKQLAKLEAIKGAVKSQEVAKEVFQKTEEKLLGTPALADIPKEEKVGKERTIPVKPKYIPLEPQEIKDLYKIVRKRFPNAFPAFTEPPKLLAIGIHQELARELKMGVKKVRTFCKIYCSKKSYTELRVKGAPRYDLNGTVVGEV